MFSKKFRVGPVLTLCSLALLTGCSSFKLDDGQNAAYAVNLGKGASTEIDHTSFDPKLPGYWLVGSEATIQFTGIKGSEIPETFCLMLRTKPDASAKKPSELDLFKIITSRYRIVTKYTPGTPAPVDILSYQGDVLVKTDNTGKYIRIESRGEFIKVTLTRECLTQLIAGDAAISWADYPQSKKPAARTPAEAEGWRRVL